MGLPVSNKHPDITPTEVCTLTEVRHRFSLRSRRNPWIQEGPVRTWDSYTDWTGALGPRDLPLLQGPRPTVWLPEPSWKESEEGNGLGRRGSGALPVADRPQDLREASGPKDLLGWGEFVGKETAWGMTLSPPQQFEVMRLNDPAETLRV